MAKKIIERPLKLGRASASKDRFTVRDSETGKFVTFHTVNADSKTFVRDLSDAFRSNVGAVLRKKK
jgi:hypothetical protein